MRNTTYAVRFTRQGIAHVETGRHGLSRFQARKLARRVGGVAVRLRLDP